MRRRWGREEGSWALLGRGREHNNGEGDAERNDKARWALLGRGHEHNNGEGDLERDEVVGVCQVRAPPL